MTETIPPPVDIKLPPGYHLHPNLPSISDYRNLRKSSSLTPVTESQAAGAIKGAWYGCHITYQQPVVEDVEVQDALPDTSVPKPAPEPAPPIAVAMGRIIGDGGWYFHIADMATLPDHQRKGLGGVILKHLLDYIEVNKPEDGSPYITLFADPPGRRLYEKNGFVESATLNETGMVLPK